MGYDVLLIDIDNTLLDFNAASGYAVEKVLTAHGVPYSAEKLTDFIRLNDGYWHRYERGEIEKSVIFENRFRDLLAMYGVHTEDPLGVNAMYADGLMEKIFYMPHCMEFLHAVRGKYRLYAVTNGVTKTQVSRLKTSGLGEYFDGVFISEQMGCKKPEKAFFDKVFAAIGPVDKSRCILLGDSLTSDMQGGRNAGIDTCLLGEPTDDARCDYVVQDLLEALPILRGERSELC